jgi:hypothetical protein
MSANLPLGMLWLRDSARIYKGNIPLLVSFRRKSVSWFVGVLLDTGLRRGDDQRILLDTLWSSKPQASCLRRRISSPKLAPLCPVDLALPRSRAFQPSRPHGEYAVGA